MDQAETDGIVVVHTCNSTFGSSGAAWFTVGPCLTARTGMLEL